MILNPLILKIMASSFLIFKSSSQFLLLASMIAFFSFTACSHSKKQNGGKNIITDTTTTFNQRQTSQATTNKNTAKSEADTTKAKAISAEQGYKIVKSNGCFSCHSTDGSQRAAPTFKNLYGRKTTLKNGLSITADSAYIAQSIENPRAKIVKGFAPIMPKFSYLKSDQIASIIAYIKSISK
jgi:cytochrome c oxidase subunit 2